MTRPVWYAAAGIIGACFAAAYLYGLWHGEREHWDYRYDGYRRVA